MRPSSEPIRTCARALAIRDPLGDYWSQFQQHLESQHYSSATIIQYGQCIGALCRQMRAFNVGLKNLDENRAVDLIARSEYRSHRSKNSAFIIRKFVRFLTALGATTPVLAVMPDDTVRGPLKRDYEEYLRRQRGLSERTIFHSWRIADRFFGFHFGKEIGDLSQITSSDITMFLQHSDDANAAVTGQDPLLAFEELIPLPLQGREDDRQSYFGHSKRCTAIWGKTAPTFDDRTSGHTRQGG